MPNAITSSSSDIFDFLKNRFEITNTVDPDGNPTADPKQMAMFTFDFITEKGVSLGTVVISLLDDNDSTNSVKVYYGKDIADAVGEGNREFYDFLEDLRKFSKVHMLGFDVRDVNRARVTSKDIAPALTEGSKFGPIDGSVKTSVQPLENVRIIIKHSDRVDPKSRGARSRRIHRIYLTNGQGERFLLPFKSLKAARAMARHVHNGGTLHDGVGEKIAALVDEIASLTKFLRHARHNNDGAVLEVVSSAESRQHEIKNLLGSLTTQRGYLKHKDSIGTEEPLTETDLDESLLGKLKVDEQISDSIPYVARAYNIMKSLRQPKEFSEFKKWVNEPVQGDKDLNEAFDADELERLYGKDVNDQIIANREAEYSNPDGIEFIDDVIDAPDEVLDAASRLMKNREQFHLREAIRPGDQVEFVTNPSFKGLVGIVSKIWQSSKTGDVLAIVIFNGAEYSIPVSSLQKVDSVRKYQEKAWGSCHHGMLGYCEQCEDENEGL